MGWNLAIILGTNNLKQMSTLSMGNGEEDRIEQKRKECPHFWNLNEDPALTNLIVHFVEKGENNGGD
jgi:hypothetical protein